MWVLEKDTEFDTKLRRWPKKHRRELVAVLDNLDTVLKALQKGTRPEQVKRQLGCVHANYPLGFWSIDQRGGGGNLKLTRLYVFPDESQEVLYQLTLGDKDSQSRDVKFCREWVESHV